MNLEYELVRYFGDTDIECLSLSEDRSWGNTEHYFGGEGYSYINGVGNSSINKFDKKSTPRRLHRNLK